MVLENPPFVSTVIVGDFSTVPHFNTGNNYIGYNFTGRFFLLETFPSPWLVDFIVFFKGRTGNLGNLSTGSAKKLTSRCKS